MSDSANTPPTDENVGEQPPAPASAPGVSLGTALSEVIKNLQKEPVLLFGLGAGLVLLIAASLGMEQLRALTVPLLAVLILAMAAWVFLEARKLQQRPPVQPGPTASSRSSGKVTLADEATVEEKGEVASGAVSGGGEAGSTSSGDVSIGAKAVIKGKVGSGKVTIGRPDEPEQPG